MAIFGAASDIAMATARLWAARGARFHLVARDPVRLEAIADDLSARGARLVTVRAADLDDTALHEAILNGAEAALGPPDVVLLAYGALGDQAHIQRDPAAVAACLHTNLVSPAMLLTALAPRMVRHGRGTIAVITSVAGERGRQSNYPYGAAKGGLSVFLSGLRHRLAGSGVRVLDIRPGYVATAMTAAHPRRGSLLWARPDTVAADIVRAVASGRSMIRTPWFWEPIARLGRLIPNALLHRTRL